MKADKRIESKRTKPEVVVEHYYNFVIGVNAIMTDEVNGYRFLQLLQTCMSSDGYIRRQAEDDLDKIVNEMLRGGSISQNGSILFSFLQLLFPAVSFNQSHDKIPQGLRLLSCIWIKNKIMKHWRNTNFLDEQWKSEVLRAFFLDAACLEANELIASQLRLIIATMARHDYPKLWSERQLFGKLLESLQLPAAKAESTSCTIVEQQRRSIEIMLDVVKQIASRRLSIHRRQFDASALELLPYLTRYWDNLVITLANNKMIASQAHYIKTWKCSKLILVLMTNSFRTLAMHRYDMAMTLLTMFIQRSLQLHDFAVSSHVPNEVIPWIGKIVYSLSKLIMKIQKSFPIECIELLAQILHCFWKLLNEYNGYTDGKMQLLAIHFFTNVLTCDLYKPDRLPSSSTSMKKCITATGEVILTQEIVMKAQQSISHFFIIEENANESTRMVQLQNVIMNTFFCRTAIELDQWSEDPEMFFHLQLSLKAEESRRAAAEHLYVSALLHTPSICVPHIEGGIREGLTVMESMIHSPSKYQHEDVHLEDVALNVDAVIFALGIGKYQLTEYINCDFVFSSFVHPYLSRYPNVEFGFIFRNGVRLPILYHRCIWLVGIWVGHLSNAHLKSALNLLLGHMTCLNSSSMETIMCHLEICSMMKSMLGDPCFDTKVFEPFLSRTIESTSSIILAASHWESKVLALACLDTIVKSFSSWILGFLPDVHATLSQCWSKENEHSVLVRGKILILLRRLLYVVNVAWASESSSLSIGEGVFALQRLSFQAIQRDIYTSNLQASLLLWSELVRSAKEHSESLDMLFPSTLEILERDYEHVVTVLRIVHDYLSLKDSNTFWNTYRGQVVDLCIVQSIGNVKKEASIQVTYLLERIIDHIEGRESVMQFALYSDLVIPGQILVTCCLQYKQNCEKKEPESVVISYIHVVAQIILYQAEWFLINVLVNDTSAFADIIDLMLSIFFANSTMQINTNASSVWYPWRERRRLWVISLAHLITWRQPCIMQRIGQIIEAGMEVVRDEEREQNISADDVGAGDEQSECIRNLSCKWKQVMMIDLKALLRLRLDECAKGIEADRLNGLCTISASEFFHSIDQSVLRKLHL